MLNKYPLWKNLLIVGVLLISTIYALPNLYPDDYALQITGTRSSTLITSQVLKRAQKALDEAKITHWGGVVGSKNVLIRFKNSDDQLLAKPVIKNVLGDKYVVALNLAATTPQWLRDVGAHPMKLGLDLQGGVHFLLQVDMKKGVAQRLEVYAGELKVRFREKKIHYRGMDILANQRIKVRFSKSTERDKAAEFLRQNYPDFIQSKSKGAQYLYLTLTLTKVKIKSIENYAVKQNLTTLRNRVNELGVAEPLVQRQGKDRIVVELPGVQDTAEAKRILGATANLEFRLEAKADTPKSDTVQYHFRSNPARTAILEKNVIATGNNVSNAVSSFDQNGQPEVNITLDTKGGRMMGRITRNSIGKRMAVVFIEQKSKIRTKMVEGKKVKYREDTEDRSIISLATIQSAFGASFRITGLDSVSEASELALLLRAGSLAAPMYFVEERTVGPSMGKKNIQSGVLSAEIGFVLVLIFMFIYYRAFGFFANMALLSNIVILVALMSIISATLTMPGIAGIVLTMGMAVDANVLINERIKEELRNGLPVQSAINAGYNRAFVSIFDSNITTLLAAVILFAVGTGSVKGFAITLSLGIITSMFTAIMLTRSLVNAVYGGRSIKKLSI